MSVIVKPIPVYGTPEWSDVMHRLIDCATKDGHDVRFATHLVEKAGEIVGYLSLCATPVVGIWLDTEKTKAIDSIHVQQLYETILRHIGVREYLTACTEESPFYPQMERLGYEELGKTVHFRKVL